MTGPMHPAPILPEIRTALQGKDSLRTAFDSGRGRASVALVLAGEEAAPHLAFIRRAERESDPWSGHMAFPGGRADPADAGAEAVAERETGEEIGIALRREQLIAPLDELPVFRAGTDTGMVLSAFVYGIGANLPPFQLNGEVAQAYWVPVRNLLDPARATELPFTRDGQRWNYPGIAHEDQVIWGLTLRVLSAFFGRLGITLPAAQ